MHELNATQIRALFISIPAQADSRILIDGQPAAILSAIVDTRSRCRRAMMVPFLFFKGFQALQAYRASRIGCGANNRKHLALYLQNRISDLFAVDIHPAAIIGKGIMMDHATGMVIGETAVVEDNVSMLHAVTLGGTGKETGDRHPKNSYRCDDWRGREDSGQYRSRFRRARCRWQCRILQNVPPCVTVAGVPAAQVIGKAGCARPAQRNDGSDAGPGRQIARSSI